MYDVILSPQALEDIGKLKMSEPKAYQKVNHFIEELKLHPKTGTGHPEPLKGKIPSQPQLGWEGFSCLYVGVAVHAVNIPYLLNSMNSAGPVV